jgi:hypothetical protein
MNKDKIDQSDQDEVSPGRVPLDYRYAYDTPDAYQEEERRGEDP